MHRFHFHVGPHDDASLTGTISLLDAARAVNRGTGGKIRSLYDFQELLDLRLPVLQHIVVDDLDHAVDNLPQVVGRNIGRHTHRDSVGSVDQKVRIPAGQHLRLFQRTVEVVVEIHRILIDIRQHLRGDLA